MANTIPMDVMNAELVEMALTSLGHTRPMAMCASQRKLLDDAAKTLKVLRDSIRKDAGLPPVA